MNEITNEFTELQLAWIDELLNGSLPQGQYRLQGEGGYCCLGVACRVAERVKPEIIVGIVKGRLVGHSLSSQLPVKRALNLHDSGGAFRTKLTLPESDPIVGTFLWISGLAEMNDNSGWSFRQIGGWIYRNPWQVFTNFEEPE